MVDTAAPATRLVPMRESAYPGRVGAAVRAYAEDNVAACRWPAEGALQRARDTFAGLLPLGLATPDNHLFEIVAGDAGGTGVTVGWVWLAMEHPPGDPHAFVYNIEIAAAHRRQGHGWRALQALEAVARRLGARSIGLHVFANNPQAQALYARLGYAVTGVNMNKPLAAA
ncbi:MAG: GNAT family N-acetyltransferase [Chitinophagaceae bacterium]|nr:GNAT family N-acetyltransferase [Rubrivivax sp.]